MGGGPRDMGLDEALEAVAAAEAAARRGNGGHNGAAGVQQQMHMSFWLSSACERGRRHRAEEHPWLMRREQPHLNASRLRNRTA